MGMKEHPFFPYFPKGKWQRQILFLRFCFIIQKTDSSVLYDVSVLCFHVLLAGETIHFITESESYLYLI